MTSQSEHYRVETDGVQPGTIVGVPKVPAAVGRRVWELRSRLKISQEELAARSNLRRNYIGSVERGERDVGITSLARIAAGRGLSLAEFFEPSRRRSQ